MIRPVGSQAGQGLAKIEGEVELREYVATNPAGEYYAGPFVDYRLADGYFRKYRIIFVQGTPYPAHLAISQRWMIHYYNAQMGEYQWMRDEEAAFLADIRSVFDGPRWDALEAIGRLYDLDYFGIDCTVLPDGRVFVFEADVAMLIHLNDDPELFPYKHQYVPRIIEAIQRMITSKVAGA